jgi:hypothetical protein
MKHRLALAGALAILSTAALAPEAQAASVNLINTDCDGILGLCTDDDPISRLGAQFGSGWEATNTFDFFELYGSGGQTGLTGAGALSVKSDIFGGYALFETDDVSAIDVVDAFLSRFRGLPPASVTVYARAQSTPTEEVPEPMTIMGSAIALGFGGMFHKKRKAKKSV